MGVVLAISASVRLDPQPNERAAEFEREAIELDIGEDAPSLADEYRNGEWSLGCLVCSLVIQQDDGELVRWRAPDVTQVWIRVGDTEATERHAQEALTMALPEVCAALRSEGIDVDLHELEALAPVIELGPDVRAAS